MYRQTRELQLATSQIFGLILGDVITALGSLGVALYYSWNLTLVIVASVPISLFILALVNRPIQPAMEAQREDLASASQHAVASLAAIDLVKVFGGYKQEQAKFSKHTSLAADNYLIQARCNALQNGYTTFWVLSIFVVGFTYGTVLIEDGLSPGAVITTFLTTLSALQGFESLLPHWLVLFRGMAAGAFLKNLVQETKDGGPDDADSGAWKPDDENNAVELDDVSLSQAIVSSH